MMTTEEKRIAIAQACGWRWMDTPETPFGAIEPLRSWYSPDGKRAAYIPDYLNDLNAMHAAVGTLSREAYDGDEGFTYHLARIVHGKDVDDVGWNFYELQEATAAQRAEAFLETIESSL